MSITTIQKSYLNISRHCSIIASALLFSWVVTLFMLPVKSIYYEISALQATTFLNSLWLFLFHHFSFILACVFLVPLVLLFYIFAREHNKGLVGFMSVLCLIGLAFGACGQLILFVTHASFISNPILLNEVGTGILLTSQLIAKVFGSLYLMLIGLWLMVNSALSFSNKQFPQVLVLLGFFTGASSILIVLNQLFFSSSFASFLFTMYTLLLLVWITWESTFLHSLYTKNEKNNNTPQQKV